MKRTIVNTLSTLFVVAAIAPASFAGEVAAKAESRTVRSPYTPHNLVSAAYNGRLEGIPSFAALTGAVNSHRVTAEDLIEAAIADGRLSEERLQDRGFVNAVKQNLRTLDNRG